MSGTVLELGMARREEGDFDERKSRRIKWKREGISMVLNVGVGTAIKVSTPLFTGRSIFPLPAKNARNNFNSTHTHPIFTQLTHGDGLHRPPHLCSILHLLSGQHLSDMHQPMLLNTQTRLLYPLALVHKRNIKILRILRRLPTNSILRTSQPPNLINMIPRPETSCRVLVVPPPISLFFHPPVFLKPHMQITVPAHDTHVGGLLIQC